MAPSTPSQIREVLVGIKPKFADGLQGRRWDLERSRLQRHVRPVNSSCNWLDRPSRLRDWTDQARAGELFRAR